MKTVHPLRDFKVFERSPNSNQLYLTLAAETNPSDISVAVAEAYTEVLSKLKQEDWQLALERVFGSLGTFDEVVKGRRQAFLVNEADPLTPFSFIEGNHLWGKGLAGFQFIAVRPEPRDTRVQIVTHEGLPYGRLWTQQDATYLVVQNVNGLAIDIAEKPPRQVQTEKMFERAEAILKAQGGDYQNVVRTWIYLSDILEWYAEFNEARNRKYSEFGLMPSIDNDFSRNHLLLPASTGIQGDNPMGASCTMDLLAIMGRGRTCPNVTQMSNIRQEDAFRYNSAFSRGAHIDSEEFAHLQLSGTASIDESGASLHLDDFSGQVQRTFENVQSLLEQKGANLSDICSATVFLQRAQNAQDYREIVQRVGLTEIPAICTVADICREELLFEIDGIVALPTPG